MKILITGIAGFAAKHFLHYLNEKEPGSEVMGIYNETAPAFEHGKFDGLHISFSKINLLDKERIPWRGATRTRSRTPRRKAP